jgi:sulfide:quinone oxidoreductase
VNSNLYDRQNFAELRRRIDSYQGGAVVLSVPPAPLQCPPAPYEFALLFAERIRERKLKGKIVLLDANTAPQPPPLSGALEAALQRNRDIVEYVPALRIKALEANAKKVISEDGEAFSYDLLCLIPPHRAAPFIRTAGLVAAGDPFVEVDPLTFRSTKFESIYAVGDAARTPYSRTASAAVESARICAHEITRALGIRSASSSRFQSVCYPFVNHQEALALKIEYWLNGKNASARVENRVHVETQPKRENLTERRRWERALRKETMGS